jgi:PAS domain S-box-containing protein
MSREILIGPQADYGNVRRKDTFHPYCHARTAATRVERSLRVDSNGSPSVKRGDREEVRRNSEGLWLHGSRRAKSLSLFNHTLLSVVAVGLLIGWIWTQFELAASKRDELTLAAAQQENANVAAVVAQHTMRTLGVEASMLYQEPRRWQELVHVEDLQTARAFIADQLCGVPAMCEIRMRHASGSYRWMHGRSVPWYDAHDTLLSAGMADDITDRKQANSGCAMRSAECACVSA